MKKIYLSWVFALALLLGTLTLKPAAAYQYFNKSTIDHIFDDFTRLRDKLNGLYQKVQVLYDGILTQTSTPKAQAYVELGQCVEAMRQAKEAYDAKAAEMLGPLRDRFNYTFAPELVVRSDKPNWGDFVKEKADLDQDIKTLNDIGKSYDQASRKFSDKANQYGVKAVAVKDIVGQIHNSLSKFDAALADARQKVGQAHDAFKKYAGSPGLDQKKKALDEIDALLGKIEAKRKEIGQSTDEFIQETKSMTIYYQGPGIKKMTVVDDLKAKADEINDLSHQVNDKAKILK